MLLRLSCVPALLLAGHLAAAPGGANVSVEVLERTKAVDGAYVALVRTDHPMARPTSEAVTAAGTAELEVPPGTYVLIVAGDDIPLQRKDLTVSKGASLKVPFLVERALPITGTVTDANGAPIRSSRVSYAFPPLSELATSRIGAAMSTTGDDGRWQLPAAAAMQFPVLVEAPGFAPRILSEAGQGMKVALEKGASLTVTADRVDPDLVISVVPKSAKPWSRPATERALEWKSLPSGVVKIVARHRDPLRFLPPVDLGTVTLTAGSASEVAVSLPQLQGAPKAFTSFLVPAATDLRGLQAFARQANGGVAEVRTASEEAIGGTVIYAEGAAAPSDVYFTTKGDVIVAMPRGQTEASTVAADAAVHPRAEAKLRIGVSEGLTLPTSGAAKFSGCPNRLQIVLPVSVEAGGAVALPLLTACGTLTMQFDPYAPLAFALQVRRGEQRSLGDHKLAAAGSAEIHVLRQDSPAPHAVVRALVHRDGNTTVSVAEQRAGADGIAILNNLPAGEDLTFEARDGVTNIAGVATARVDPGKRIVIDPLEIPQPASLVVAPELEASFKSAYPKAVILGVILERELPPADRKTVHLTESRREAAFENLAPGRWHLQVLVQAEELAQPIDVETVDLKASEAKRLDPKVKPVVFTGQVVARGNGIAASLGIKDEPGPNAIRRKVETTPDGAFRILLPREGLYYVDGRRSVDPSAYILPEMRQAAANAPSVDLGTVLFEASSPSVVLEWPDARLSVRVQNGEQPAGSADVIATTRRDNPGNRGVAKIVRRAKTDGAGVVTLGDLPEGTWIVEARDAKGRSAEKTVRVARSGQADVTLDFNDGSVLDGKVIDAQGVPASNAAVDCSFLDAGEVLRTVRTEADLDGQFSLSLPKTLPAVLHCGVTTTDGAVAAFMTRPNASLTFALAPATGTLAIPDWGEKLVPDRFWLVARDGRLFNLSWAARKIGRAWSPLIIPRLQAGEWKVVRVNTTATFAALGRGLAGSLPSVADVRLQNGQRQEIRVQDDTTYARR